MIEENMAVDHSQLKLGKLIKEAGSVSFLKTEERIIQDSEILREWAQTLKSIGLKVVLTMGTFDLVHIGHARYVRKAREHGDILIVGIDDDLKARGRKGENRPVVPQAERLEMMTNLRWVDIVALKRSDEPRWGMIKTVCPNVLIAVEGTYTPEETEELKEWCEEVVVLNRQAETSTSAQIRKQMMGGAEGITQILVAKLPEMVKKAYEDFRDGNGKGV